MGNQFFESCILAGPLIASTLTVLPLAIFPCNRGDADGERHEKVFDAAWSGDRRPGTDGKLPAVGNTVDVANATWTNTIGSPELITVWTDPEFDPNVSAAYYARVLEILTPRWTAYEAKRFGIKMKKEIPMVTVERACTSPIWYNP